MTTRADALNDMVTMFTDYWGLDFVQLPGKKFEPPKNQSQQWAKMKFEHVEGRQATLRGEAGTRRFRKTGQGTVELYFPITGDIIVPNNTAEAVERLYQGKRSENDVWFRNVRIIEDQAYNTWYKLDVVFEFEYDTYS
jgi:hypothetical protein